MNKREMLKLVLLSSNKFSREEISKTLGTQDSFSALDLKWITKKLQGENAEETEAVSSQNSDRPIEFAALNETIKKMAKEEGLAFRPLDLLKLFGTNTKFASFVSSRAPLRLHKNILAVSDMVLKSLKEL